MSTSLHAIFNVASGNVNFVIVISNILGGKMWFSESSQKSMSEKSIFGHFEVGHFSQHIYFCQGGGGWFLLVHSNGSILTKRWAL